MDILIFLSEFMVPLTVFYIVGSGILAKRPVFDDFLDGAKEGMRTVAGVSSTLIGLCLRTSNLDRIDDCGGSIESFRDSGGIIRASEIPSRTLPYPGSGNSDHPGEDHIQFRGCRSDP